MIKSIYSHEQYSINTDYIESIEICDFKNKIQMAITMQSGTVYQFTYDNITIAYFAKNKLIK